jgi:hypothetical protein
MQLPFSGLSTVVPHATCVIAIAPTAHPHCSQSGIHHSNPADVERGLLAVGSRCGRVAILDVATMQVLEVISVAAVVASASTAALSASFDGGLKSAGECIRVGCDSLLPGEVQLCVPYITTT